MKSTSTSNQRRRLLSELGDCPVTRNLATAYITRKREARKLPERDVIEEYRGKLRELRQASDLDKKADILAFVLKVSIADISAEENHEAVMLIVYIASICLPSDIPCEIFLKLSRTRDLYKRVLRTLHQYAIIKLNEGEGVFDMDRLLQTKFKHHEEFNLYHIISLASEAFTKLAISSMTAKHVNSIWARLNMFDQLVVRHYRMAIKLILHYFHVGKVDESRRLGGELSRTLASIFGPTHRTRLELTETMQSIEDDYRKGTLELKNLSSQKSGSRHEVAVYIANSGRLNDGLSILQKICDEETAKRHPQHPETLVARGHIACLKYRLGESSRDKVYKTLREVLEEVEGRPPITQLDITYFRQTLASILCKECKWSEAVVEFKEIHKMLVANLGDYSQQTVKRFLEVAYIEKIMGKHKEAFATFEQIYCKQVFILGPNHPATLETIRQLETVEALISVEKNLFAVEIFELINFYDIMRRFASLKDDKIEVLLSTISENSRLDNQSPVKTMIDETSKLSRRLRFKDATEADQAHREPQDKKLAKYKEAWSLLMNGYSELSQTTFIQTLRAERGAPDSDNSVEMATKLKRARFLHQKKRLNKALELYVQVYEWQRQILGPKDKLTLATIYEMAEVLHNLGRHDEAIQHFEHVHRHRQVLLGWRRLSYMVTDLDAARSLIQKGNLQKALMHLEWILQNSSKLGHYHPYILKARHDMAVCLAKQNKVSQSADLFSQVYNQQRMVLGENHSDTKATGVNLPGSVAQPVDCVGFFDRTETKNLLGAIGAGNEDEISRLFRDGLNISRVTAEKGNTLLHLTCKAGHEALIKTVLEHAKKQLDQNSLEQFVNKQTSKSKNTPLHIAAKEGHTSAILMLLENGAIYDLRNAEDKRPVDLATSITTIGLLEYVNDLFEATERSREVVEKLRKLDQCGLGALAGARNSDGRTLIWLAIAAKNQQLASELAKLFRGAL